MFQNFAKTYMGQTPLIHSGLQTFSNLKKKNM